MAVGFGSTDNPPKRVGKAQHEQLPAKAHEPKRKLCYVGAVQAVDAVGAQHAVLEGAVRGPCRGDGGGFVLAVDHLRACVCACVIPSSVMRKQAVAELLVQCCRTGTFETTQANEHTQAQQLSTGYTTAQDLQQQGAAHSCYTCCNQTVHCTA
eukprot:1161171-Pelagomonas_calceolata.AAC.8